MGAERHVTFIAMSGVRIVNDELREMGMTLPGFVERGQVIASLPSLGVLTLAGHTPSDWTVDYIEVDAFDETERNRIADQAHGLVAISSLSARIEDAYLLADAIRALGKKVVMGGLHASVLPDEAANHADAVVVGEGEPVWQEVLRDYGEGNLRTRYLSPRERSFTPWALPRYDLLDPKRYNRIPLQTTRGCPLDCSFCAASRMISHYKRKPVDQIEQELDGIEAIWRRPFIELADDNSFVDKRWAREMVRTLGRRGIRWFTESDISLADDDDLLALLADNGCAQVLIGFESVDENSLSETDTKDWKRKRRDRYLGAIQKIQERGVSVNGCFIFGFDHDEASSFESTARFVRESGLAEVQVTILTPFPGTALHAKLKSEGRLIRDRFWESCTLFDLVFEPAKMTRSELESGFRSLVRDIYSVEESARRKAIFRECVKQGARNARNSG